MVECTYCPTLVDQTSVLLFTLFFNDGLSIKIHQRKIASKGVAKDIPRVVVFPSFSPFSTFSIHVKSLKKRNVVYVYKKKELAKSWQSTLRER